MNYITPSLLADMNVTIPDDISEDMIDHLNETLRERIGMEVVTSLSEDKLIEYLALMQENNAKIMQNWLQKNVPEIKEIVSDEIDILLGEIATQKQAVETL